MVSLKNRENFLPRCHLLKSREDLAHLLGSKPLWKQDGFFIFPLVRASCMSWHHWEGIAVFPKEKINNPYMKTSILVFFLCRTPVCTTYKGGRMLQERGGASVHPPHSLLFLCLIISESHTRPVSHFLFVAAQGMPRSQDRSVFMVSCLRFAHTNEIAE